MTLVSKDLVETSSIERMFGFSLSQRISESPESKFKHGWNKSFHLQQSPTKIRTAMVQVHYLNYQVDYQAKMREIHNQMMMPKMITTIKINNKTMMNKNKRKIKKIRMNRKKSMIKMNKVRLTLIKKRIMTKMKYKMNKKMKISKRMTQIILIKMPKMR